MKIIASYTPPSSLYKYINMCLSTRGRHQRNKPRETRSSPPTWAHTRLLPPAKTWRRLSEAHTHTHTHSLSLDSAHTRSGDESGREKCKKKKKKNNFQLYRRRDDSDKPEEWTAAEILMVNLFICIYLFIFYLLLVVLIDWLSDWL